MGATEGLGYASWVVVVRDLSLLSAYGPNLARIALDNWDYLSRHLFDKTRVESEISSCGAR